MEQKIIEQELRKQKDNAGMLFTKLHYRETTDKIVEASIKMNFEEIYVNVKPDGWNDKFETAKTLTDHEIGHWKTCPYDLSYHLEIVSNIVEVVKQKLPEMNLSDKPMENDFIHEIANIYEDIIDNLFIEEHNFSEIYARTSSTGNGKLSKGFQFALGIQIQLWGTEEDYKLLLPFIEKDPFVSAADYLKEIGIDKDNPIKKKREKFNEKKDWGDYAGKFTKYYLKYYDPNEEKNKDNKDQKDKQQGKGGQQQGQQGQQGQNQNEGQGQQGNGQGKDQKENDKQQGKNGQGQGNEGEGQDKQNKEGNGQGKNENDKNQKGQGQEGKNDSKPTIIIDNNPFDEETKDMNKVRKAIGKIANRKGMGPAQKIAKNLIKDDISAIDLLLDSISPEIEIKHKKNNDGYGFPLIPLTKKMIDINDVGSNLLGIGIDEYGEPNLEVGKIHYPINIQGAEIAKQIPDFLYIIDDSGSMGGLSVGDKYFMAMMGLYGTKNWLAKNGHIDYIKFGLIQFSSSTRAWGFETFEYAHGMKKLILNPQNSGTALDIEITRKMIYNHNKKLIIIMLSDGDIYNWNSINNQFKNLMRLHQFTFLGIQGLGNAGHDLSNNGFNAINITNPSKLHEIVIDVAASSYSDY